MRCEERRKEIIHLLSNTDKPVSASKLADTFGVSRQIIVKDIAQLRNEGIDINSGCKGYLLKSRNPYSRVFKTIHSDDDVNAELNLIVSLGGIVKDVFIYHKVYGVVSAEINIKTLADVKAFLNKIAHGKSSLLKNVTSGYHYHTITADNTETLDIIETKLKEMGFLAPLQKYEPEKIYK